jgi:hypothetical protein
MMSKKNATDKTTPAPELAEKKPSLNAKKADRAMDNMFRIVLGNHLQLSMMADQKANMIITACALILTLSLGRLQTEGLFYTVIVMVLTCVATMLFAILATIPKLPPRLKGQIDLRGRNFNLLFFGYFSQIDFETFFREIEIVVNDRNLVYENLAKDLYDLGLVLSRRKYKYIRISYQIFLAGLLLSLLTFILGLSQTPAQ